MSRERLAKMMKELLTRKEFEAFFREAGRRGGKIGGKRAAAAMTPEQRSERARKAARSRWAKKAKP
jgi:hypothetical protein